MTSDVQEPETAKLPSPIRTKLAHLDQERERCLAYAAALSNWSMFWKIILVGLGALIAAQGAFVKVWGDAAWVTVLFIVFGLVTAAGSGFDAVFKPGERSPKFAAIGFEYERVARDLQSTASALLRQAGPSTSAEQTRLDERFDEVLRRADDGLDAVRQKELALYVTGPTRIGRGPKPTRRRVGDVLAKLLRSRQSASTGKPTTPASNGGSRE